MKEKLKLFIEQNYEQNEPIMLSEEIDMIEDKCLYSIGKAKRASFNAAPSINYDYANIDDFINNNKNESKFQTLLFKYIDERNLKDSDVYNKVNIDRRLFSKIRSDSTYHPSKETVILLGLSLELNENEIVELLDSASYSLPKNNYFDLIIRFCFINKIYNVMEVNDLLYDYKCKSL